MRTRSTAGLVLLLAFAACSDGAVRPPSSVPPTVTIANADEFRGRVLGNVVSLDVAVTGLEIVKADGDTSGRTGHLHVFVDRPPVAAGEAIPVAPDVIHSAVNPVVIPGLSLGQHLLTVVLGDGTHHRISEAHAERGVFIEGPSIDASVPAGYQGGPDLRIDVRPAGVRIVAADGDQSGQTGHYHYFVDREPVAAGEVIPKEDGIIHATDHVFLNDLEPGPHRVWVLLGDGSHRAFKPLVADLVTFTVTN